MLSAASLPAATKGDGANSLLPAGAIGDATVLGEESVPAKRLEEESDADGDEFSEFHTPPKQRRST